MRNNVTVLNSYNIHPQQIDELLPFTGKQIWFRGITNRQVGYGRWELELEFRCNGQTVLCKAHTTDSMLIDEWCTADNELNQDTITKAILMVLEANQDYLEDLQ